MILLRILNQRSVDLDHAIIVYGEATTLIRQAEVTAQRTVIEPPQKRFGTWFARLTADVACGSANNLTRLVDQKGIEPDIPLLDKSASRDGTFDHGRGSNMAHATATTEAYITSRRQREKVAMLFAHPGQILKLDRLRLRGPNGAKEQFLLATSAKNLRELAKTIAMPA